MSFNLPYQQVPNQFYNYNQMNQPQQSIPVIYSPRQQQSSPRLLIESKDQQQ